jgi:hypothetical protein
MRPTSVGWFLVALFLVGGAIFTVVMPDIWIGQIWMAVALGLAAYYVVMIRRATRAERLKREGIPGEGRILEMTQTGTYVNQQPRVRLKLRIEAPGVPAFEAEDTYTVPLIALGALTGGRALRVYLDRADPARFTIDWFGEGGRAPALASFGGAAPIDLNANPAAREAVLETLRSHGIDPEGSVDLRQRPAARAAVLDALARHGIDVAHGVAAAAPTTSVQPPATPLDRLQKLTELRQAGLITEDEFEKQKARILDAI